MAPPIFRRQICSDTAHILLFSTSAVQQPCIHIKDSIFTYMHVTCLGMKEAFLSNVHKLQGTVHFIPMQPTVNFIYIWYSKLELLLLLLFIILFTGG